MEYGSRERRVAILVAALLLVVALRLTNWSDGGFGKVGSTKKIGGMDSPTDDEDEDEDDLPRHYHAEPDPYWADIWQFPARGFQELPDTAVTMLYDESTLPRLGLGTWRAEPERVGAAVAAALRHGYRHFDLADRYLNHREIGAALEAERRRWAERRGAGAANATYGGSGGDSGGGSGGELEIFVTSKLWNSDHRPERVRPAVERMLRELRLPKLDLLLMHWPIAVERTCEGNSSWVCDGAPEAVPLADTWRAMMAVREAGLVRSLGVSNFGAQRLKMFLKELEAAKLHLMPAVNQIELHPYLPQHKLVAYCQSLNIKIVAYCPIGSPGNAATRVEGAAPKRNSSEPVQVSPWPVATSPPPPLIENPVVNFRAALREVTPAQLLLQWNLQRGIAAVIPKSTSPEHIRENGLPYLVAPPMDSPPPPPPPPPPQAAPPQAAPPQAAPPWTQGAAKKTAKTKTTTTTTTTTTKKKKKKKKKVATLVQPDGATPMPLRWCDLLEGRGCSALELSSGDMKAMNELHQHYALRYVNITEKQLEGVVRYKDEEGGDAEAFWN
jgi:alcohol dehydrogenase (NADP+)